MPMCVSVRLFNAPLYTRRMGTAGKAAPASLFDPVLLGCIQFKKAAFKNDVISPGILIKG